MWPYICRGLITSPPKGPSFMTRYFELNCVGDNDIGRAAAGKT